MSSEIADSGETQRATLFRDVSARLPRYIRKQPEKLPSLYFCSRAVVLLCAFVFVDRFAFNKTSLTFEAYSQPILVIEIAKSIGVVQLTLLAVAGLFVARYGVLFSRWTDLRGGRQIRWFILFLAVLMAWPFTTYGFNHYVGQGHYLDRALVPVLVLLLWYRPFFIYPFIILTFTIMWQLGEPQLGGSIFAHKLQVLHVLNLFGAAFLLHAISGSRRTDTFIFMTCCLVAAAYWEAGIAKLEIGWLQYGELSWIPFPAYAHGWLANLQPEAIIAFANALSWFDKPMVVFVLVIETGCLFFLWRRSLSMTLLVAVCVFHIGVFILFGFLFWTWILLNLALLTLLWRDRNTGTFPVYGWAPFILSLPLIAFGSYWAKPPHLGWFDTKLAYTYRLEAIGESGKRYPLPASYFAPFEDVFTMTSFGYLPAQHGMLVGPYGVTHNHGLARRINSVKTPEELFTLENDPAFRRYDPARAKRFYAFISRFVSNRNLHAEPKVDLRALPQFWSFRPAHTPPADDPVRLVEVTEYTSLFDGKNLRVVRKLELARLSIRRPDAAPIVDGR